MTRQIEKDILISSDVSIPPRAEFFIKIGNRQERNTMFDIKEIKAVVQQIAEARHLPESALWEALEIAFATAYKREYGKSDQIIRCRINQETGESNFFQVKQVLDKAHVLPEDEAPKEEGEERVRFNPERHMMVDDAQLVRQGVTQGEEILFPLESKTDFGRIAAQSARQAITQKIHEAEREAAMTEFQGKEGKLVHGQVQRIERGNVFIDLGRTVAILPFSEQIRGERFNQGDTVRAFVQSINTERRSGGFVRLSRSDERFVIRLFETEVPELTEGVLEIKAIARDPGTRTKIAVESKSSSVDPVGAFVGQRGVRVMTVKSELNGEQIDIINWPSNITEFIGEALLPAEVMGVEINEKEKRALVKTSDDQIPVAIGRGGQNLKLASKLTDWEIVITDPNGTEIAQSTPEGEITIFKRDDHEREKGDDKNVEIVESNERAEEKEKVDSKDNEHTEKEEAGNEKQASETESENKTT